MSTAVFQADKDRVWIHMVLADKEVSGFLDWSGARQIAEDLKLLAQSGVLNVTYNFMMQGHALYVDLTPDVARKFARGLYQSSLLAEEHAKAEQIARDSAILIRSGAPFTLSNNPKIMDIAATVAAWDRDLRRFMPSIKSEEKFGLPTLIQEKP